MPRPGYLTFYTNYQSAKSAELEASGKASMLFTWLQLHRQLRVVGTVAQATEEESDAQLAKPAGPGRASRRTHRLARRTTRQRAKAALSCAPGARGRAAPGSRAAHRRPALGRLPAVGRRCRTVGRRQRAAVHDRARWQRNLRARADGFDADPWSSRGCSRSLSAAQVPCGATYALRSWSGSCFSWRWAAGWINTATAWQHGAYQRVPGRRRRQLVTPGNIAALMQRGCNRSATCRARRTATAWLSMSRSTSSCIRPWPARRRSWIRRPARSTPAVEPAPALLPLRPSAAFRRPQIALFLVYTIQPAPVLPHSVGLQRELTGVVHLFATRSQKERHRDRARVAAHLRCD